MQKETSKRRGLSHWYVPEVCNQQYQLEKKHRSWWRKVADGVSVILGPRFEDGIQLFMKTTYSGMHAAEMDTKMIFHCVIANHSAPNLKLDSLFY